ADGDGFVISTATEPIAAAAVVIATGYNAEPVLPAWARANGSTLPIVHSNGYRDAAPYRDESVLVVGAGNSGSDIALDLAGGGARQVWLSARTAPGVVPRQALGLPAQVAAIPLSRAPRPLADGIAKLERRLFIGDLAARGLPASGDGVFTRHARRSVLPILDHGFAGAVKAGGIAVVPSVETVEGEDVVLEGGRRLRPDAVVAATGYRPALVPLVGHLGVLGPAGLPPYHGGAVHPALPKLHLPGSATRSPARCASCGSSPPPSPQRSSERRPRAASPAPATHSTTTTPMPARKAVAVASRWAARTACVENGSASGRGAALAKTSVMTTPTS